MNFLNASILFALLFVYDNTIGIAAPVRGGRRRQADMKALMQEGKPEQKPVQKPEQSREQLPPCHRWQEQELAEGQAAPGMQQELSAEDRAVLEELQGALWRYSLWLTGSRWDAEDLVQDTWLKALDTLRGDGHANPEALLLRIAKNTWLDQVRRRQTGERVRRKSRASHPLHAGEPQSTLELQEALQALLKHLPLLQCKVWLLREIGELSAKETADRLNMSEGAVKAALHRARQHLFAVRRELEAGVAAGAGAGNGLRPRELEALATACQTGNIAAVLHLLQQEELRRTGSVVGKGTFMMQAMAA